MIKALSSYSSAIFLSSSILLTGCGSDGGGGSTFPEYTGNTAAAAISSSNAEDIGTTAGEAVQSASNSTGLPTFATVSSSPSDNLNQLTETIMTVVDNSNSLSLPTAFTQTGSCGGSINIPDTQPPQSGPFSINITFTEYCDVQFGSSLTFNGTAKVSYADINDPFSNFTFQYVNFTVDDGNETTTINVTMDCPSFGNCTFTSNFVGADGTVHQSGSLNISGDATSGFNGSMSFSHSAYGTVSATISNVSYGACGAYPDGGTITFTGTGGSSGDITFVSDCTYSGNYDDGTSTGTFSGSFTL